MARSSLHGNACYMMRGTPQGSALRCSVLSAAMLCCAALHALACAPAARPAGHTETLGAESHVMQWAAQQVHTHARVPRVPVSTGE
jgi:hypothetical protein